MTISRGGVVGIDTGDSVGLTPATPPLLKSSAVDCFPPSIAQYKYPAEGEMTTVVAKMGRSFSARLR